MITHCGAVCTDNFNSDVCCLPPASLSKRRVFSAPSLERAGIHTCTGGVLHTWLRFRGEIALLVVRRNQSFNYTAVRVEGRHVYPLPHLNHCGKRPLADRSARGAPARPGPSPTCRRGGAVGLSRARASTVQRPPLERARARWAGGGVTRPGPLHRPASPPPNPLPATPARPRAALPSGSRCARQRLSCVRSSWYGPPRGSWRLMVSRPITGSPRPRSLPSSHGPPPLPRARGGGRLGGRSRAEGSEGRLLPVLPSTQPGGRGEEDGCRAGVRGRRGGGGVVSGAFSRCREPPLGVAGATAPELGGPAGVGAGRGLCRRAPRAESACEQLRGWVSVATRCKPSSPGGLDGLLYN